MSGSKKGERRRHRLGQSEKVFEAAKARRMVAPVVVEGVGPPKLILIQPDQFKKLGVDERYQRVKITESVNTLIHVIKAGGIIADPVSIAERSDGSWWIMDGQQRYWAHDECRAPMRALLYAVPDFETERKLFIALNSQRRLGSDYTVHSWPGPSGAKIREWGEKPTGPLYGKINFGPNSGRPYGASVLARALHQLLVGRKGATQMIAMLARTDTVFLEAPEKAEYKADALMRVLAFVFEAPSRLKFVPALSIAEVCRQRWENGVTGKFPSVATLKKIKRINWDMLAPSASQRFVRMLVPEIEKRWPAA